MAHALMKGAQRSEFVFTSYLCHPSLANNELSGPILLDAILSYIRSLSSRKYSYRFILGPETVGALAYLQKFGNHLKKYVRAGFVLSCVGDDRAYSLISSPTGKNLADLMLRSALIGKKMQTSTAF